MRCHAICYGALAPIVAGYRVARKAGNSSQKKLIYKQKSRVFGRNNCEMNMNFVMNKK